MGDGIADVSRREVLHAACAATATLLLPASIRAAAVADAGPAIVGVAVSNSHATFTLSGTGRVRLMAFPIYADAGDPRAGGVVWEGDVRGAQTITASRFGGDGTIDRLFRKFRLCDAGSGRMIGAQRFATDLTALPAGAPRLAWPASIKGVSCPVDVADLVALGVRHTHINLDAAALVRVDEAQRDDAFSRRVDGQRIWLNPGAVQRIDRLVRELTEAGINILGVVANHIAAPGVLTHPRTDREHAPNKMGAFNLTDDAGVRHYRAVMEFLSDRYCTGRADQGSVGGWIIGNEVDNHWIWHNLGPAPLADVARQYADELRLAWYAVRNAGANVPVFASFDHFWTMRMAGDPLRYLGGRSLVDALAALAVAEGNFPWHVAQHPYPENLFEPRFWLDRTATRAFDSPRITFKNVEVLAAYLQRDEMKYDGKPRRLILSEQGFHAGSTLDAERVQAAAFALAYHRLSRTAGVEAFILHRHVDHPREGGLRVGLWAQDVGAARRKRPIWDVMKAADTDAWADATAFALPIVGLADWNAADPRGGRIEERGDR